MDMITPNELHDDEALILDSVDRFLEVDVKPYVHALEAADEYPAEIVEKMKELGLFGCLIKPEYGGLGLSTLTYAKIIERISAVWMSVSGIINSHLIMAMAVQRNGTEEQKQHFLPLFATGEKRGGIALTEPDCGTDLQAIRTRARARRRPLRRQRHQDLDHQRHVRQHRRPAGEDRPGGAAAPQGHEPAHRREGPGLPRQPQAAEARLQGHRHVRAVVRGLSGAGEPADRRHRRPRAAADPRRARTRPHQRRRPRRRRRAGGAERVRSAIRKCARPSASRSASTRPSSSSSATWRHASRPRGC